MPVLVEKLIFVVFLIPVYGNPLLINRICDRFPNNGNLCRKESPSIPNEPNNLQQQQDTGSSDTCENSYCFTGVHIKQWDFSGPQYGKGACDCTAALAEHQVRLFIDENNKCTNAREFVRCASSYHGTKGSLVFCSRLVLPVGNTNPELPVTFDQMEIIYYCEAFKLTYRSKCDKSSQIRSRRKRFDPPQANRLTYDVPTRIQVCAHYIEYWNKNCTKNGVPEADLTIRGYCNLYRTMCDTLEEDKRIVASGGTLTLAPEKPKYKLKHLDFDLQVPMIADQDSDADRSKIKKRRRKMRKDFEDNPYFCSYFEGRCYSQNIYDDESRSFCSIFSFTQNSYCPAYTKIEFRLGCALYRKYCMNNAAQFELINWAVI